jgi:hypothetical protein
MREYVLGGLIAGLALVTAGCGSDSPSASTLAESPVANSSQAAAGQNVAVKLGDSPVGKILVGPDGRALYGLPTMLMARALVSVVAQMPGRQPRSMDRSFRVRTSMQPRSVSSPALMVVSN